MRIGTPFVNVIWENSQYGSIVWKQDKKFGRHFGTDFTNPDFVKLAESFGMPAWRCESVDDFCERLPRALDLERPLAAVAPLARDEELLGDRLDDALLLGGCAHVATVSVPSSCAKATSIE